MTQKLEVEARGLGCTILLQGLINEGLVGPLDLWVMRFVAQAVESIGDLGCKDLVERREPRDGFFPLQERCRSLLDLGDGARLDTADIRQVHRVGLAFGTLVTRTFWRQPAEVIVDLIEI